MNWKFSAARVAGESHLGSNTPCQDSYAIRREDDVLICCICDGAGSASSSQDAADIAAALLAELCAQHLAREACFPSQAAVQEIFEQVRQELIAQAAAARTSPREYACTALVAMVSRQQGLLAAQIGDGAMVARCGGIWGVILWPEETLYANVSSFLSDEDAMEHLQFLVEPAARIDDFAAFTDGLQRLSLHLQHRLPHPPFFTPLFDVLRSSLDAAALSEDLAAFIDSAEVNRLTDDDKTLVLASWMVEP